MGMPIPAPAPAVNAWDKPINLATSAIGSNAEQIKFDKSDQHDSGIDISEPQNSASSSTRSSPSSDNKVKGNVMSKVACHSSSLSLYLSLSLTHHTVWPACTVYWQREVDPQICDSYRIVKMCSFWSPKFHSSQIPNCQIFSKLS